MLMIHILFILSLLISTNSVHAKNYLAVMGAGGEPKGSETIFDAEIPNYAEIHKTMNAETKLSFDGGHSVTENTIKEKFSPLGITNSPFTSQSYKQIIEDYTKRIQSNEIKKDDQLMLIISTHGSNKGTMKTHKISTLGGAITNLDTVEGTDTVSMDDLEELTKLAEEKGVKLAIIDLSCHSGNALNLKNSKTCVISSTGPNHYSFRIKEGEPTFTENLLKNFKKGKTLEDVYLEAREKFSENAFPMISSPAGLDVNRILYETITPYLYYKGETHDKFTPFLNKEIIHCKGCKEKDRVSTIQSLVNDIESFETKLSSRKLKKIKKALLKYNDLMMEMKKKYYSLNVPEIKRKENFCTTLVMPDGRIGTLKFYKQCKELTVKEIISDHSYSEDYYKRKLSSEIDNDIRLIYEVSQENVNKIIERKKILIAENPDLGKISSVINEWPKLEEKTNSLATKVNKEAQKLYQDLYNEKSKETNNNPCKDFKI